MASRTCEKDTSFRSPGVIATGIFFPLELPVSIMDEIVVEA